MKILPLKRRSERGLVGPILGLLVVVIGAVMLYKIYKLAEHLLPPPPPPPPPCQTNAPGTTNPPIIVTNMSADAAWIVLGPDTNTPGNTMNVMYGLMSSSSANLAQPQPVPVMVGCSTDAQGGGFDASNVLAQIQNNYGVAFPGEGTVQNGHGEYEQDPDTGALTWHSWSVNPTNISFANGTITVQEWANDATPRTVILQRSTNGLTWTNLTTNTISAGQFQLYRDTAAPVAAGFYRTEVVQ